MSKKHTLRLARARRTHAVARASGKARLLVFRSNKAIYAHIIDDKQGKVLCGVSSISLGKLSTENAKKVGEMIAEKAKAHKVTHVAFDRNGYRYHGRIQALADGARSAGLTF